MSILKELLSAIKEGKCDKEIEELTKKQEVDKWKNTPRFNQFLSNLVELIEQDECHCIYSDDYEDNNEFITLIYSLYEYINSYAKDNEIPCDFNVKKDDDFLATSYCIDIFDKLYNIKLYIGQGSYILLEKLDDKATIISNKDNIIKVK